MHQVVLERWSQQDSPIHRRDPRAKLAACLVILLSVALAPAQATIQLAGLVGLAVLLTVLARLHPARLAARLLAVVPFPGLLALIAWASGEPARAWAILWKSCISAYFVLWLVATTPVRRLLAGLLALKAPEALVLTLQFLYRYLFVVSEQAQHMLMAARARGGTPLRWKQRRLWFQAAVHMVAVLFLRSYQRAGRIHQAMLARGFTGQWGYVQLNALSRYDFLFAAGIAAGAAGLGWLQRAWS